MGRFLINNGTDRPVAITTFPFTVGIQLPRVRFPAYQGHINGQWKDLPVYYDGAGTHSAVAPAAGLLELDIDLAILAKVSGESTDFRVILRDENTLKYIISEPFKFDPSQVKPSAPTTSTPKTRELMKDAVLQLKTASTAGIGRFTLINNTEKPLAVEIVSVVKPGEVAKALFPAYQGLEEGWWKDLPTTYTGTTQELTRATVPPKDTLAQDVDLGPLTKTSGDNLAFRIVLRDENTLKYIASGPFKYDTTTTLRPPPIEAKQPPGAPEK
jgi:hypothetical protein